MTNYALELKNINKSFGNVYANKDISIKIEKGTIHGIIGENGAGKSTLMNIIYGFYNADSGKILINEKETEILSSLQAIDLGIGMVHQHFMLVETFSVIENIILGYEHSKFLKKPQGEAKKKLNQLADDYGLKVDINKIISELTVGDRQRVEILKALYRDAKILILDEPTGVLTPDEADQLFKILNTLKEQGVTVIIITHKLREIMSICDNVSVMRGGKMIGHRKVSETSMVELAELMVGRKLKEEKEKADTNYQEKLLEVNDLVVYDSLGVKRLKSVSIHVKKGEIVAIAGVSGNGQTELLQAIWGMNDVHSGSVKVMGSVIDKSKKLSPKQIRNLGVSHIPEDRLKHGLIKEFSASESSILGIQDYKKWDSFAHLSKKKMVDWCDSLIEEFDVRPVNPWLKSANFSGGNQQKLIVGRELSQDADLILVGQPTRGVDIGAIELIHDRLLEERNKGRGILLVSVELEEILSLADRIYVMFDGLIVGEISAEEADEKKIGLMMANAHENTNNEEHI